MAMKVLLVLADSDIRDEISELLKRDLSKRSENNEEPVEDRALSEDRARQCLKDKSHPYDLLVVQAGVPATEKTPIIEQEMRGLKLLEFVKSERPGLPCIVLVKTVDGQVNRAMKGFDRCELVETGESLEEDFCLSVDRLLRTAPGRAELPEEDTIDVEIEFSDSLKGHYKISRKGRDNYYNEGDLIMEQEQFQYLLRGSKWLTRNLEYNEWREGLQEIGEGLLETLKKNARFTYDLGAARTETHIDHARFLFKCGAEFYPLVLEAIKDKDHRFWMLDAPVMRRLPPAGVRRPLFQDKTVADRPINCLVIESAVEGYVDDEVGSLPGLANVPTEAKWLEAFLNGRKNVKPRNRIGRVLRINRPPKGGSFREHLRSTLKDETSLWHLVHYAGHSVYKEGRGYVLLPGSPKGSVEKVDIEEFASWLRRTDLIYMSSCHSSESDIAFELARNGVPAIVAFRWDINDARAAEHAQIFYTDLFAGSQSIEYAFLKARQDTYNTDKTDRTWAAPMLILQIRD